MFAGFVIKKSAESQAALEGERVVGDPAIPGPETAVTALEPGTMTVLMEGEDIKFSTPTEVGGSYEAFIWRNLLAICAGVGVPYTATTGDTSKNNYSSQRGEQIEFRRRIDQVQHLVLVFQMCRPIWQRWFETAVLAKAIPVTPREFATNAAALLATKWIPPKWDWVDPWKDRKAMQVAVQEGWISRSDVIEAEGEEPEATDARIKADQDRELSMDLKFRPVTERLNVNLAAEAANADDAVNAADERGAARE